MKTRTLACLCIIGFLAVAYVASVSAAAMTLTLPQIETLERWLECLARARPQVREEFEDALEVVTKRYWW